MSNSGYIKTTWNINNFKSLEYKFDTHKDDNLLTRFENAGHNRQSMTLYNYFEPNPMPPVVFEIANLFSLDNVSVAINLFKPGQYLPYHVDLFQKYRQVHGLEEDAKISRIIVMLEDSEYGQISQVRDQTYGKWSAGFYLKWYEPDFHAFYNFSTTDRYAIQITGVDK